MIQQVKKKKDIVLLHRPSHSQAETSPTRLAQPILIAFGISQKKKKKRKKKERKERKGKERKGGIKRKKRERKRKEDKRKRLKLQERYAPLPPDSAESGALTFSQSPTY